MSASRPSDDQLRKLGASLREIDPSTLQSDPEEGTVRWFLGDSGTEIFVWLHQLQPPHHIQLVFARVSVEWSAKGGLLTGTFKESASMLGGRYDPYLLTLGRVVDPEVCRAAVLLLSAASLPEPVLDPLRTALDEVVQRSPPGPAADP